MFVRWTILCALSFALCLSSGWSHGRPGESFPESTEWQFRAWQTDEGLPDNGITGVAQAADGYLWVASLGGLMRFNGDRFDEFPLLHLPHVPNRVVRQMLIDRTGRLWLAMDRGSVVCADRSSVHVYSRDDGLLGQRVAAMAADGAGGLWLAYGEGFVHLREGRVECVKADAGLPSGEPGSVTTDVNGRVWLARGGELGRLEDGRWQNAWTFSQGPVRMAAGRSSGLWIADGNTLYRFDEGSGAVEVTQLPTRSAVQALFEDASGAVWIGTAAQGLLRWSEGRLERVPTSNSHISCLAEDEEGNIWAGTAGGGLNRLRLRTVRVIGAAEGLPFESLRAVCEDTHGVRWAVTENGLLLRNTNGLSWLVAGGESGWSEGNATCVTADRKGALWVGTSIGCLVRLADGTSRVWRRSDGLKGRTMTSLLAAANGDVWVATGGPYWLHRVRGDTLQAVEMQDALRTIRAMAEAPDGTLWAGTSEGQLLRVLPGSMAADSFYPESRPRSIRYLTTTSDGALWIGYAGRGVGRWKDGRHVRITPAQGLYDDYVSQILPDDRGNLWMNSNHGLFVVPLNKLTDLAEGHAERVRCTSFGREEGLPSLQPSYDNFPSTWRFADGSLAFALRNGLAIAQPRRLVQNPPPPPVLIERVALDEQTVARHPSSFHLQPLSEASNHGLQSSGALLHVPPRHQKIEFEFAALSFSSPENVHFRHRLSGFDSDWVAAGSQRSARYPRLPAGRYTFEVIASRQAGIWNPKGVSMAFVVEPFFWQTWWFRVLLLLTFTGGVVAAVRYVSFRRLHRELEHLERQAGLQRERARIARDMHDEVGAKLSRLSLLSDLAIHQPDMPALARAEVSEISETARETIRSFEAVLWAVNPRNDSLPNLVLYLCRFAEELFEGTDIQCAFDLPGDIPSVEVSTELRHHVFLAAKEALHNVLKHAGARQIWLRLELTRGGFKIQIEDDGRGFACGETVSRAGGGNGVENMRARMRSVGGAFEMHSEPGKGTRVTFTVPSPHFSA